MYNDVAVKTFRLRKRFVQGRKNKPGRIIFSVKKKNNSITQLSPGGSFFQSYQCIQIRSKLACDYFDYRTVITVR